MIAFGYIRVAIRGNEHGMQQQYEAIQAYAKRVLGDEIDDDRVFIDDGVAATTRLLDRPEGGLLSQHIALNQGEPDEIEPVHLVVHSMSCLTRRLSEMAALMTELS